jgi:hypothetical protein
MIRINNNMPSHLNFHWMDYLVRINSTMNPTGRKEYQKLIKIFFNDSNNSTMSGYIKSGIVYTMSKEEIVAKGVKRSSRVYPGWLEWQRLISPKDSKEKKDRTQGFAALLKLRNCEGPFGKYQYLYKSKKGEISLLKLKDYNFDGEDIWEIYAYENMALFPETKRFSSKKKAEEEIIRILK